MCFSWMDRCELQEIYDGYKKDDEKNEMKSEGDERQEIGIEGEMKREKEGEEEEERGRARCIFTFW